MRKADKPMDGDDVPADFSAGEVHVYVHAKDERDRAPRKVTYVALVEAGEAGLVENVIPPLSSSRYVRRCRSYGSARRCPMPAASRRFPPEAGRAGTSSRSFATEPRAGTWNDAFAGGR